MATVADDCPVGKITYNRSKILGNGCDGTAVFEGLYGSIPVAVKRILSRNVSVISSEIDTICKLGGHRNILKYFATEEDHVEYCFIAFELCAGTLVDWVKGNIDTGCCLDVDLLRQATEGLDYLHSLKIVHRDIKPQNILISPKEANDQVIVKIADFGFCKPLKDGHSAISMSDVRGTSGWIAPEVLKEGQEKVSSAIDVFALGCVFYYVLSKGGHPFGPGSGALRMVQISKGKFNLPGIDSAAKSIIQKMIDSNPKNRPSLKTVLASTFLTKNTKDKSPSPTKSLTASPDLGSTTPKRERPKTASILRAIRKRISSGSDSKEIEYNKIFAEGKVKFNIESIIVQGNFGICFFRGEFAGKSACIKRIPYTERAKNEFAASNEIRVLNSLGFHAHIVTLFKDWKDEKFYFLAMELHDGTLKDLVSSPQKPSDAERLRILREAVQGIAYVHNRGFLYMKLEPTSFRLVTNIHNEVVVKLANFESCIEMGPQGAAQNFVSQNFEADFDWIAPEIVAEGRTSISHKADVFSMGCIFYYVLSGGKHPFGDETVTRRKAIKSGFNNLTFKTLTTPYATNLVKQMIDFRPNRRPTCQEVLNSPLLSIQRKQNQNSSFTSN